MPYDGELPTTTLALLTFPRLTREPFAIQAGVAADAWWAFYGPPATTYPKPPEGLARERFEHLRAFIAGLPDERFDMTVWSRGALYRRRLFRSAVREPLCACIGGWAGHLFGVPAALAGAALGLGNGQQAEMFTPRGFDVAGRYSRADAVAMLDRYIGTGVIAWK
jgi:hypothetical protein